MIPEELITICKAAIIIFWMGYNTKREEME